MRKQFVENQNLRIKFIGTFIRFGMRNNFKGMPMETLLFTDIRSIDESIYEDHVWFNMTKEFNKIEIEISILTPPIIVEYKDFEDLKSKIRPYIDGVIIEQDGKRSTFLPQVWDMLPNFDDFFAHLCYKGGFEVDDNFKPKVYKYEVEKIK